MNELARLVVLLVSVIDDLMTRAGFDRSSLEWKCILQEIDALNLRLAHSSRAAVNYHLTARGKAALEEVELIAAELRKGVDPADVKWRTWRWSQEQASGPMYPGMTPGEAVDHRRDVTGVRFVSTPTKPEPGAGVQPDHTET